MNGDPRSVAALAVALVPARAAAAREESVSAGFQAARMSRAAADSPSAPA